MRKEVADLLRTNKQENARIRVEAAMRENLLLQAYEVLELFLELLAVRVQLVERSKDVPPDMIEALSSLIYSAQRVQASARSPQQPLSRHPLACIDGTTHRSVCGAHCNALPPMPMI